MKPNRPFALLAVCAAATAAHADDTLRIDAQPLFSGMGADNRSMAVTLENDGPDARGMLRVIGSGNSISYPVDLPQGSRKRIVAVNNDTSWGSIRLVLDTDRGAAYQTVYGGNETYQYSGSALMIGGTEGDLDFLEQKEKEGRLTLQAHDLYVSPEDAPDRAVPYAPYSAVVLGPESVALRDATVAALKDYALGGGTLVFLGGQDANILGDARWADVLPGKDWRPKNVSPHSALATMAGIDVDAPFTVVEPGSVAPGTGDVTGSDSSPLVRQRGLGLGRVVVLGYSPLDAPLRNWDGRLHAFAPLVRNGVSMRANGYVAHYLNQGLNGDHGVSYGSADASNDTSSSGSVDPFSTRLPSTESVAGMLALYFVLVVPVSFLVLRKMKRGELAWVTAPLLSLGFAGALFRSAEGLYAAKLSTAAQGVVVVQEGQPRAMFFGTSQMFFPHSGSYDLGLQDVDGLTTVRSQDSYGSSALAGFDPVDDGKEVKVPSLEANNLAFREMSYSQRIPNGDWFRFDAVDGDHVRVENRSPYRFEGSVAARSRDSILFDLMPGKSTVVKLNATPARSTNVIPSITDPHSFTDKDGRLALSGRIHGFRPGPQIGRPVQSQSGVDVIAFAQEKMP